MKYQHGSHQVSTLPENSQRDVLFPWTVFSHSNSESRTEEKLSCRHKIALLRRLKLQHSAVPDEGMKLTVDGNEGNEFNRLHLFTVFHL